VFDVYFEIKNTPNQKLETTEHIAEKYEIHPSTIFKARTKMVRLGLIAKARYGWQFCSIFKNI
jgi:DNA-binding transcriptional regulator YhcF (GntR family)